MSIQIVTIGKKHEAWINEGVERFSGRLNMPFDVKWVILPNSSFDEPKARQNESDDILKRLDNSNFVILLDERGKNIDSPTLTNLMQNQFVNSKSVTFIIGGAYGVDDRLRDRADFVWSLSNLVFPHQLVRLILIEQIYRAQEIAKGSNYHHK